MISEERISQLANDPYICNISGEVREALNQIIRENAALREALTQLVAVGPDYFGPDKAHLLGGSCCSSMTCEWCQARAALADPPKPQTGEKS